MFKRKQKKILLISGLALVGVIVLLAQDKLSTTGVVSDDGLPGQPSNGWQQAVKGETAGQDGQENDESGSRDFVDPREVKDAYQNISDLKKEINRVSKEFSRVQGSGNEVRKLKELLEQVKTFENSLRAAEKSGGDVRSALQEYYDEQIWETVNQSRRAIQIPKDLAQITKELKRLDGLLKGKSFTKLPLDQAALKNNVETIRKSLAEAKSAYEGGDLEAAEEALQPIHDGMHPGEVMGVLYRFRDLATAVGRVRDTEIRAAIDEVLAPVIEATNDGDFREANSILNDYFNELMKLVQLSSQLGRSRSVDRGKLSDLIDKLQNKVSDKAESFDQRESERD